jgi:threonylcarbamoyladenosine tRNA methylthiotransferase MtaB
MPADILTFGCRLNAFESEVMRGHTATLADTVIVNTCAVTAEAERQARQAIRRVHRERPGVRILVTGCAAKIDPARWAALPGVVEVVDNDAKLRRESWVGDDGPAPAAPTPVAFAGRTRAIVQVQQGCDHRCTFCIIPFGRGPSRSLPPGAIVDQARSLLAAGYRELVLSGVDLTAYGADLPEVPTLGGMVRGLLAALPELPRLRLSSLDPAEIDADLWRLIEDEGRLMPHLHLSVQAGADLILKRMRRRHSRDQTLAVIRRARAARPGIGIGADLIAGFPTETEALFAETLALVEEAEIPYLHIFPYSERPGTPAARMPPVPQAERRERAARLRAAGQATAARFFAGQVGREVTVLAETERGGHSEQFAPVSVTTTPGALLRARVFAANDDGLLAEPA